MKNLYLIALLCLFAIPPKLYAQDDLYRHMTDSLFQHLDKSEITTGVLYDRVFPLSRLNQFNLASPDTSNYQHFIQAYSEFYRAAYAPLGQPQKFSGNESRQVAPMA